MILQVRNHLKKKTLFNEKPQAGQTDTHPPNKKNRINKVNRVSVMNNYYPLNKTKDSEIKIFNFK